jgi:hypothetical protein
VRKIVWGLVVAVVLGSAPVPLLAASPTHASCKRSKKPKKLKFVKLGKYKVHKFKKLRKRQTYRDIRVRPVSSPATPDSQPK